MIRDRASGEKCGLSDNRLEEMKERRLRVVPKAVLAMLVASLAAQIVWQGSRPDVHADAASLPAAPSIRVLRAASAGDPTVFAKMLMLWLQAHDNQSGVSVPFMALDYAKVSDWLDKILALDPRSAYPLLAASRVYAAVPDAERKRHMLDFVYEKFYAAPDERWPWVAHAAIVAKHELEDLPLALKYARAITEHATGPEVPNWARDMSVIVLEDMGELESAKLLIGGLIHSGRVSDPHELRFLEAKLAELERASDETKKGSSQGRDGAKR